MTLGGRVGWAAGVGVALLIGFGAGVWAGGEIEAGIHEEFLASADLPQECWDRIEAAAAKIIRDYEGTASD